MAYDMAAIEHRGLNAVTNFDLSRYIKCLRPNHDENNFNDSQNSQQNFNVDTNSTPNLQHDDFGFEFSIESQNCCTNDTLVTSPLLDSNGSSTANGTTSSALVLLLQSSKFKDMLERTSMSGCPSTPSESKLPRRSFPDDIQTYFGCQDSSSYTDDDIIFGDLDSLSTPLYYCELDI